MNVMLQYVISVFITILFSGLNLISIDASPTSVSKQKETSEEQRKPLTEKKNNRDDEDYQPQITPGNLRSFTLIIIMGLDCFNVYMMKLYTSDTKCSHLFKLVPVADSESDADFTEEDESEDETFTVKNKKKVVKQKTEKKAAPAAKNKTEKKDKKPTKASKGSGTFFLFLTFTVKRPYQLN